MPVAAKGLGLAVHRSASPSSNMLGYASHGRSPWLFLALMVVLGLATVPVIGIEAVAYTPYLAMLSALELPAPAWKWAVGFWVAAAAALAGRRRRVPGLLLPHALADHARRRDAPDLRRARAASRTRRRARTRWSPSASGWRATCTTCSGHSLTALSVKAELAARLIDVDPARAKAELESIQATARQALAEVRATVGGLRAGNLEAELAAAPRGARRRRHRRDRRRHRRRHRPAAPGAAGLGAARVGHQRRTPCARDAVVIELGAARHHRHRRRRRVAPAPRATGCAACASGCRRPAARSSLSGGARAPACGWCCRDPAAAGRRPGARPRRAGRAARPRDRPRGRRPGRSRRRGGRRRPRLGRRGLPARHRDARAHRHRGGRARAPRAARGAVADRDDVRPPGLRPPRHRRGRGRLRRQGHPGAAARRRRTPRARRAAGDRPGPRGRVADRRPEPAHRARERDPDVRPRRVAGRRDRRARCTSPRAPCATTCPPPSARPARRRAARRPGSRRSAAGCEPSTAYCGISGSATGSGSRIRSSWAIVPSSSSDGSACWASAQVMSDSVAQTSTCCTSPASVGGAMSCA